MTQPFRSPHQNAMGSAGGAHSLGRQQESLLRYAAADPGTDCSAEPPVLTYRQAREILHVHDVHGPQCRQWLAAAAYLSAGLDDE
ncbi:hypothetical protein [Nocardia sp. NBC_00416]|uniref:hypothetical protein n=1 Tax=Nocardia sp. NBC_00416 TaxID=2975991 RepID=UPI002E214C7F